MCPSCGGGFPVGIPPKWRASLRLSWCARLFRPEGSWAVGFSLWRCVPHESSSLRQRKGRQAEELMQDERPDHRHGPGSKAVRANHPLAREGWRWLDAAPPSPHIRRPDLAAVPSALGAGTALLVTSSRDHGKRNFCAGLPDGEPPGANALKSLELRKRWTSIVQEGVRGGDSRWHAVTARSA